MKAQTVTIIDPHPGVGRLLFCLFFGGLPLLILALNTLVGGGQVRGGVAFMVSIFVAAAVLVYGLRKGVMADPGRKCFIQSLDLYNRRLKTTERAFADYDRVEIHHERRSSSSSDGESRTYWVDAVYLMGLNARWRVGESKNAAPARELAEKLVRVTGFRVIDHTGDEPVVRSAAEIDLSLRERREKAAQRSRPLPEPPAGSKLSIGEWADATEIRLPPPSLLSARMLMATLPPLVIGGAVFATGVASRLPEGPVRYAFPAFFILLILVPLVRVLWPRLSRPRFLLTDDELAYARGFGIVLVDRVRAEDIEDITSRNRCVRIAADNKLLALTLHSSPQDVEYLVHYLKARFG